MGRHGRKIEGYCAARSSYRYNAATVATPCQGGRYMIAKSCAAIAAGICLGICLIGAAGADDTPDTNGGRYTFNKVAEGLLRLDGATGEVSLCSRRTVGWACQAVPEDRAVLEDEIARLRRENAALKKNILAHGLSLPDGATTEPAGRDGERQLGADSNLDRMVAFVDRVWHRLVEAIAQAQKQVLNKS
jgi:hypothetical protein